MGRRLDAINMMLDAIGEAQVSSLENTSGNLDLAAALRKLQQQCEQLQEEGWYFNTEERTLSPDVNGEIVLPENIIRVDSTGVDYYRDVIEREGRLYDKDNTTFIFDRPVQCEIVLMLDFESLPAAPRRYVELLAASKFITNTTGDSAQLNVIFEDLKQAKINLDQADSASADGNILELNNELSRRRSV